MKDKIIDRGAGRAERRRKVWRLGPVDARMVVDAANELAVAHLCGDPEYPDQLRALIEVLRQVGLADS